MRRLIVLAAFLASSAAYAGPMTSVIGPTAIANVQGVRVIKTSTHKFRFSPILIRSARLSQDRDQGDITF